MLVLILDHFRTLNGKEHLGDGLLSCGYKREALNTYKETLAGWSRKLGSDHPNSVRVKNKLLELS